MDPALAVILRSWTFDPWLLVPLEVCAILYLRGWWLLHCQMPQRFTVGRLVSFQAGLFALFLALASPLEALAHVLLQAHMAQHLVLMMVAPPLMVYGAPCTTAPARIATRSVETWAGTTAQPGQRCGGCNAASPTREWHGWPL